MNIFHQLRWKLTLSYTIVTVCAFLVIILILGGILFAQIFVPRNVLSPEGMIDNFMKGRDLSTYPVWSQILSQSPVDLNLVELYAKDAYSIFTSSELFRIGAISFGATTYASIRVLITGPDGTVLGTSIQDEAFRNSILGKRLDPAQIPGLEAPLKAAMAGDKEPNHLYTTLVPDRRYVFAAPLFNTASEDKNQVVGVMVVLFDAVPTQGDIPAHIFNVAAKSLLIFLLGIGVMGAIFGGIFANGLTRRFTRISETTDLWSEGDFSRYIEDAAGDEIAQFSQRLNNMARQLQSLLRRRQDMAVSEERNRLARDLHDSAKQQALAASLELGTAITLYDRDPGEAKKHLLEADGLVDAVRKELTNLVHELRPQEMDGQDFSEILKEYAIEWSQRSGIELNFNIEGNQELPLEARETLFRIAQEALANIARHSAANRTDFSLVYEAGVARLTIQDDGIGFDPHAQRAGIGLYSMRERAESLGGRFIVDSAPGQGTRIQVSLPINTSA